ncbi:MAG TPA: hypothetical protein VFR41_03425 [Acidimicrobiia bacterium]|nr:hypothetical protein [Acidimicrobiia bacterium]
MADLRTTITEVVTGLGMLDLPDIDHAVSARPDALVNVGASDWDALQHAWKEQRHLDVFHAAWMNGQAFLNATDALRNRAPLIVEWKGAHRAPGDEVVPADLRVDHVYLVSCKYLSRIVTNASPHHLFDRCLAGGQGRRSGDWFREVAPNEHDALYALVRRHVDLGLPSNYDDLDAATRKTLATALRAAWPDGGGDLYGQLVARAADASATRWRTAIGSNAEAMLWRLLRIGSAPYFVLGVAPHGFVRLRIATPWDWRRQFELRAFDVEARTGGQPIVDWTAIVRDRADAGERTVCGHVEVRWSHGRFCGPPEAKVYLDTPHDEVPGYFPLR